MLPFKENIFIDGTCESFESMDDSESLTVNYIGQQNKYDTSTMSTKAESKAGQLLNCSANIDDKHEKFTIWGNAKSIVLADSSLYINFQQWLAANTTTIVVTLLGSYISILFTEKNNQL